jgi:hypothetical protein
MEKRMYNEFAVEVNVKEVLDILRENRKNHKKVVDEAIEGYQKRCLELLEQKISALKAGKPVEMVINLTVPQDHTKDYDRVIKMLEMSQNDTIMMGQDEFSSYVEDDWSWRRQWAAANSGYTASAEKYL